MWAAPTTSIANVVPRMQKPPQKPLREVNQTISIDRGCSIPDFVVEG
jgi:hypothetical protein